MSRPSASLDDDLVFLDERTSPLNPPVPHASRRGWRVMIIDDDADVHSATIFALSNVEMQQRPLESPLANSAVQAR